VNECYLDDDGGPLVSAVEAADPGGHRQSLHVRTGPAFYGNQAGGPVVWIEYQPEHEKSPAMGPVLLIPEVWRELNRAVEQRLREREKMQGKKRECFACGKRIRFRSVVCGRCSRKAKRQDRKNRKKGLQ
jgi:hypothetical protein